MAGRNNTGISTLDDFDKSTSRMLEGTLRSMAELKKEIHNDVPKIVESVFAGQLLPILTDRSKVEQIFSVWQGLAGHVRRPIDVIDDRTQEVLFRVPPPARQLSKRLTGSGRNSAYEIAQMSEKKGQRVPAARDAHLKAHLSDKVTHTPVDRAEAEHWNWILTRYGYDPIFKSIQSQNKQTTQSEAPVEFDGFDTI